MNSVAIKRGIDVLKWLDGWKTYTAAAGLVGLAVWQFSQGQYEQAAQSFLAGLAAFGVRHAMNQ